MERTWMQREFEYGFAAMRGEKVYTVAGWLNELEAENWTVVEVHTAPYAKGILVLILVVRNIADLTGGE